MKKAVAWMLRPKWLLKSKNSTKGPLTVNELNETEITILKHVQNIHYCSELDPFKTIADLECRQRPGSFPGCGWFDPSGWEDCDVLLPQNFAPSYSRSPQASDHSSHCPVLSRSSTLGYGVGCIQHQSEVLDHAYSSNCRFTHFQSWHHEITCQIISQQQGNSLNRQGRHCNDSNSTP